jgi:molecular chaperone DnaK
MASTVWGIDLGTTYSCIARVDDSERPVVISNREGFPTTPSVVVFTGPEDYVVGAQAVRQAPTEPENVSMLVKRHMGDPDWGFTAHGKRRSAPEISALILRAVADDAEQQTGEKVQDVVITVPAYFGVAQREATKAAGKIAGLNVIDIINEPTAAAFSYGFAQGEDTSETVLVYDLGGGTFDVTVIRLDSGAITPLVTDGNHMLGGANWDEQLLTEIVRRFTEANPDAGDPLDDEVVGMELRQKAEETKQILTGSASARQAISMPTARGFVEITREEFEAITRPLLDSTIDLTRNVVREAEALGADHFDRVLLVGGSSFMPAVKQALIDAFGWTPELSDPNQAVAKGAALAGSRADLRAAIEQRLSEAGKTIETATPEELEQAAAEIAPERGMRAATAVSIATRKLSNVLSKGFGVALLKPDADPGHSPDTDPASFEIKHLVQRNDPVPLTEPRREKVFTTVHNQSHISMWLYEQGGADLSGEVLDNTFLTKGGIELPGDDPVNSPLEVEFHLAPDATLTATLKHPRVATPLTLTHSIDKSAIMSEQQIEAARASVSALRRG